MSKKEKQDREDYEDTDPKGKQDRGKQYERDARRHWRDEEKRERAERKWK